MTEATLMDFLRSRSLPYFLHARDLVEFGSEAMFIILLIAIVAAPSVFVLTAIPEILGAKPRVAKWGMLGALASFTSILLITSISTFTSGSPVEITKSIVGLLEFISLMDAVFLQLIIAGGCAGLVLGYQRKKFHARQ